MRWLWIDRVLELTPAKRMVAIKHLSLAEEHLHDHFAQTHQTVRGPGDKWWNPQTNQTDANNAQTIDLQAPLPLMPASLIIEGMAQTAGILVGHANQFKEKVVLAKVTKATIHLDATAGQTLRYTAHAARIDTAGAATRGRVDLISHHHDATTTTHHAADIDLMFSHIDNNLAGQTFPEHNFVFADNFKTLLQNSGIQIPS